jgi:hypothetical protein
MTKKSMTEVVALIVDQLNPLSSEERQRVVQASLMLLGESFAKPAAKTTDETRLVDEDESGSDLPVKARSWIRQNGLSRDQLGQVFHFGEDGVECIASEIPGKTNREKVRNAYVLSGIARLLEAGDSHFADKVSRKLCEDSGFYDHTNHSKYVKGGNEFIGSREKGWTLTAPGLKQGVALVQALSRAG